MTLEEMLAVVTMEERRRHIDAVALGLQAESAAREGRPRAGMARRIGRWLRAPVYTVPMSAEIPADMKMRR